VSRSVPASRAHLLPALTGALLLGALAGWVLLLAGGGSPQPVPAGLPDPGPVTTWGLPVLGYAGQLLTVAVVGALLVPLLTGARPATPLAGPAASAVRAVRVLAPAWVLVTAATVVLTASDQFALPLGDLSFTVVWEFARVADQGQALVAQVLLVLLAAWAAAWSRTVGGATAALVLALLTVVPPVLTGHAASAGSHDAAVVGMLIHLGTVVIWVGGLVALWWHLGSAGEERSRAARRFSAVAGWCFALTAVSGIASALVRLGSVGGFVTTDYGLGALAKVVALAGIGLLAARLRRRVRSGPLDWRRFGLLSGIELAVMTVAIGLGVALSRTPPPVGEPYTSAAEGLLGGPVPPAPTAARLLLSFTPSGVGLAVLGLGTAVYLAAIVAVRRRGDRWSVGRTVAWIAGLLAVSYATAGGLGVYSQVSFSYHMAAHMVLSMVAPILLVIGAPVTLLLRALPGADVPGGVGPRQLLSSALRSWPARLLSHPIVATVIFVASLYAVYFTGLFGELMSNHLGHAFMEVHFLFAGYLFFEVLIGEAPLPRRPPHLARLGLLLLAMPFHAFFAIGVMNSTTVIGGDYYAVLDRGWATDLLDDQYLAGSMTWALGEVPMVMMLVVLLAQWYRSDQREARRIDRRSDRDDDAELAAYNARLAELARRDEEG